MRPRERQRETVWSLKLYWELNITSILLVLYNVHCILTRLLCRGSAVEVRQPSPSVYAPWPLSLCHYMNSNQVIIMGESRGVRSGPRRSSPQAARYFHFSPSMYAPLVLDLFLSFWAILYSNQVFIQGVWSQVSSRGEQTARCGKFSFPLHPCMRPSF